MPGIRSVVYTLHLWPPIAHAKHYTGKPESSRFLKVQFAAVDRELAELSVVSAFPRRGWTGVSTAGSWSGSGGAARDDRVVWHVGPGDFEVIAFGVVQVGRAAGEELGVDRRLGHAGARGAHLLGQLIDLLGSVDHDPDGEADAFAAGAWFGVPVAGELSDREHCQDDAADFECRELFVIDDLWPAELAVELPEPRGNHVRRG